MPENDFKILLDTYYRRNRVLFYDKYSRKRKPKTNATLLIVWRLKKKEKKKKTELSLLNFFYIIKFFLTYIFYVYSKLIVN